MKDGNIKNIIEIYENVDLIYDNYKKNNNYDNDKYINYYKDLDSFSNLFKPIQRPPRQPIQRPSGQTRWSPVSSAGIKYEWDRGVIGISKSGEVQKEELDGTLNHHADATIRIANSFGHTILNTANPFAAAVDSAKEGLLIFQSEGDNAFVYFPDTITEKQLDALIEIITPRADFNFGFSHREEVFDVQTMDDVLNYARRIVVLEKVAV